MAPRLSEQERRRAGAVFEEHRGFVEAVAVRTVGRDDAPDVVAEVGLRICLGLNGLREPGAIRTWLYKTTQNIGRDMVRDRRGLDRARGRILATTSPHERVEDPDETVRLGRRRAALLDNVERLKPLDKSLICNDLGVGRVSVGNGADRVARHRARTRLRAFLTLDPRLSDD